MKILVLTSTFPRWLGDKEPPFVYELCKRIAANHEVHAVAPHAKDAALTEELTGINVHRFRYAPENQETLAYEGGIMARLKQNKLRAFLIPSFLISQLVLMLQLQRTNEYDVIHAHWVIPQGLLAIILKVLTGTKPKIIITAHGGDIYGLKKLNLLKRWIIQKADLSCYVSQALQQDAQRILNLNPNANSTVASMGVDAQERFTPDLDQQQFELIFVGRFTEKKGLPILLEALKILKTNNQTVKLTIIGGDSPSINTMQALATQLDVADQCNFVGSLANEIIPSYLKKHRIFVFPSIIAENGDAEGLGLTALEAMACECLLISSDIPTSREYVCDGETGLLFKAGDSALLADKILLALTDRKQMEKIAQAGRRLVLDKYDWNNVSIKYEKLFQSIIRK